jgi:hypothetical protein
MKDKFSKNSIFTYHLKKIDAQVQELKRITEFFTDSDGNRRITNNYLDPANPNNYWNKIAQSLEGIKDSIENRNYEDEIETYDLKDCYIYDKNKDIV